MKKVLSVIITLVILSITMTTAFAGTPNYEPYYGYNYDAWYDAVSYPNGYIPDSVIRGFDLDIGDFKNPKDFYVDERQNLYILDSGNNRIIILNKDLELVKVIDEFVYNENLEVLNEPEGIFVSNNGEIVIADTGNQRVLFANEQGEISSIITKPETSLLGDQYVFTPTKVLKHESGITYVLARGIYHGALVFDIDNEFMGFFGSSFVQPTLQAVLNRLWRQVLTRIQRGKMQRTLPSELSNFDIDDEGFIYTTSIQGSWDQVRKLNLKGDNIMRRMNVIYGDKEFQVDHRVGEDARVALIDIKVGSNGFFLALDEVKGRVFEYDQFSTIISIFGGKGNQVGTFSNPVAVEIIGENILVLDSEKANITIFKPTPFITNTKMAINLYNEGRYDEAVDYWEKVLSVNSNSEWAYRGIGRSLYEKGDYSSAVKYFKLGLSPRDYNEAFGQYRKELIRDKFGYILTFIIVLFALIVYLLKRKSKLTPDYNSYNEENINKYLFPLYCMIHPIDGFEQIKTKDKGSILTANAILLLWFLSEVFRIQNLGFHYTAYGRGALKPENFNIIFIIIGTVGIFITWTVSNWAQCTLVDGKGKYKEIWIVCGYSLTPYVIGSFIATILTNFMVWEEAAFIRYLVNITTIWSVLLLLVSLLVIHQFTLKKTIISIVLSVFGVGVTLFLITLFYGLHNQLYMFIRGIYEEMVLRL